MAGFKKSSGAARSFKTRLANFSRIGRRREDYRNGVLEMAGGQRINAKNANMADRVRERVRMAIETAPMTLGLARSQKRDTGKRTGRRADAAGGARLALARSAASRTDMAARSTSVLGMRSSSRVASATPRAASNGQVKAYTRMQNGQAIFVGGYSRTV